MIGEWTKRSYTKIPGSTPPFICPESWDILLLPSKAKNWTFFSADSDIWISPQGKGQALTYVWRIYLLTIYFLTHMFHLAFYRLNPKYSVQLRIPTHLRKAPSRKDGNTNQPK
jgi:hypothetical protein